MLKTQVQSILNRAGYEVRRRVIHPPASSQRPLGDLISFLEDSRKRGFRPKVIADIGANEGHWTRAVLSVFPDAQCLMFEPVPAFAGNLKRLCETCNARYWGVGVSDSDGTLEIDSVTRDGAATSGSTFLESTHDGRYSSTKIPVEVRSLDSLVTRHEIPAPELVKIDVEGFEMSVLRGAESLFGSTELFIIELSLYSFWKQPIFHEVVAWMAARGYLLYDLAGFNRRPVDGTLGQVDACFVKSDSRLRRAGGWDD
jgi:FkbM family methyltransferase